MDCLSLAIKQVYICIVHIENTYIHIKFRERWSITLEMEKEEGIV